MTTPTQEKILDYLIRSGHASTRSVARFLWNGERSYGHAQPILERMLSAGLIRVSAVPGGGRTELRWEPTDDAIDDDRGAYASVTDELNDGWTYDDLPPITLDDLDAGYVRRAERYASTHDYPWPPSVGDFDRFYEREHNR